MTAVYAESVSTPLKLTDEMLVWLADGFKFDLKDVQIENASARVHAGEDNDGKKGRYAVTITGFPEPTNPIPWANYHHAAVIVDCVPGDKMHRFLFPDEYAVQEGSTGRRASLPTKNARVVTTTTYVERNSVQHKLTDELLGWLAQRLDFDAEEVRRTPSATVHRVSENITGRYALLLTDFPASMDFSRLDRQLHTDKPVVVVDCTRGDNMHRILFPDEYAA